MIHYFIIIIHSVLKQKGKEGAKLLHSTFGIKKTRVERGLGGKSLILENIPTLSHTAKNEGKMF